MAQSYFPCPDAGSIWSACTYTSILDAFDQTLREALSTGLVGSALQLLQILGALEVAVLCTWWALYDDGDQMLAHLFVVGVKIGIFAQVIAQLFPWSMEFADGAISVGLTLGLNRITLAQFHDPGSIMLVGWQLLTPIFQHVTNLGLVAAVVGTVLEPGTMIFYGVLAIIGWACVAWLGFTIIVGWVELMLLAAYGVAMIPFLVFEYTRWMAAGVLSHLVAAAWRMGVFAFALAMIFPVMQRLMMTDIAEPGWDSALALVGAMGLFTYLTYRVQAFAAGIAGAGASYTGGGLIFMASHARQMGRQAVGMVQVGRQGGQPQPARVARSA